MNLKVRIRNFQVLGDVKLEAEGLTVVTGRTNLGKTSLIRAIAAVLYGLSGDYFLRRGSDYTGGAVQHNDPDNPLKVVWRKVPTNKRSPNRQPALEINGKTHTKIGRDHKALTAPYGITEIETTTTKLRPQVAMQHDPIFLVGETETAIAEVFKLLSRVDVITGAQNLAHKDLKNNTSVRKVRRFDLGTATERKLRLNHVPELRPKLEDLRSLCNSLSQSIESRKTTASLLEELDTLNPRSLPSDHPPVPVSEPKRTDLVELLREFTSPTADTEVTNPLPEQPLPLQTTPDLKPLLRLKDLNLLTEDLASLQKERQTLEATLSSLLKEKEAIEDELGTCPVCSRTFHQHPQDPPK